MNPDSLFEFTRHFLLSQLLPAMLSFLVTALVMLVISAVLAPLESLGWWAGWFGQPRETPQRLPLIGDIDEVDHYVVYLSGIGEISGEGLDEKEKSFLAGLAAHLPDLEIVKDVFPYAMNNNGLTSQRLFAALWRWIQQRKLNGKVLLANLINIRNLFQVAVSADRRYGPIYNYGTAEVIQAALLRRGYKIGHGKPVTLIGYSGGGQIAIGAATYLKTMLKAPLQVISLGGTFADDPGLVYIDHLYHLYGQKDIAQQLATLLYAGRWPLLRYSTWNQAKAEGRVTMICVGPMRHRGSGGYLDDRSYLPTGQSYQDHSVEIMARLISSSTGPLLRTTDKNEDNQ